MSEAKKTVLNYMPATLEALVEQARTASASKEAALTGLHSLDLTSLNDNDTPEVIAALTAKADQGDLGHVAATCVYSQFLTQTFNDTAKKGINRATVINFPSGKGTVEQTLKDTEAAIARGANEIDIVMDYESFLKGDGVAAAKLMQVCKMGCGDKAKLKVILESAAFDDYKQLDEACDLALVCGADFLKTSTGKSAKGGASLEAAATMLHAIQRTGSKAGVKMSGGVKTVTDCAQYIALTESLMGKNWISVDTFRFGASSVLNDIVQYLKPSTSGQKPAGPASNY